MTDLYRPCPDCGGFHISDAAAPVLPKLDKEASRIAREIYAGEFKGVIDDNMTVLVARHLADAMNEGTGTDIVKAAFTGKDYALLDKLEKNIYSFSSAKDYHQLKLMSQALKDDKGNIRPFADFKDDAMKINKVFNKSWLETEYNTAISSANASARWAEYDQDKDVMPFLKYQTVEDDRVRDDHALLDQTVKPVDDGFWDTYYPPNGFNCRCTTVQLPAGTSSPDGPRPELPKMFRTNLGKKEILFPQGHPYYEGLPKSLAKKAEQLRTDTAVTDSLALAKTLLLDATVKREEGNIIFTTAGIERAINDPQKNYLLKVRQVPSLDKILKDAEFVKSVNYTGSDKDIKALRYYQKAGENQPYVVVQESQAGELSLYTMTDKIRKANGN